MNNYEKPVVQVNESAAEGVYAASGVNVASGVKNPNCPLCESNYMLGVFQAANSSADPADGYKARYGCEGCREYWGTKCGVEGVAADAYGEYDTNKGYRLPPWEYRGYGPDDEATQPNNPPY